MQPRSLAALLAFLAAACLCAAEARAADAVVQVQRPPHHVGEPILVRVRADGFAEEPAPTCVHAGEVEGVALQPLGATPNVSMMVQIIQGRRTEERSVTWTFDFYATAGKEGEYVVGPFALEQGGLAARTGTVRIAPRPVPLDPDMRVRLKLPSGPVFPGQRVAVEVEWAYAGDLDGVENLTIRSPLFDRFPFEDAPLVRGEPVLPLTTAAGVVRVKASGEEVEDGGKKWLVLRARRTLVPSEPGTHELGPITVSMDKVTRWQRSMFGDRVPSAVERVRAQGNDVVLVVAELPREGRPASFAGAIGRGLTFEAAADRTVVRVGDPITLALVVRGDVNLENAGLPGLAADGGLDPSMFRLPEGQVAGTVEDGAKTFRVTVRVENPSVSQIPSLAYSYFDPEAGAYRTVRSDPIALQVEEGQIVSARDVVSAAPGAGASRVVEPTPTSVSRPRFDVTGADLSLPSDPDRVLTNEGDRCGGRALRVSLYVLGGVLLLLAFLGRRRAAVDPELVRRRALLSDMRARLDGAVAQSAAEGAREAAAALRVLAPEVSPALKAEMGAVAASFDEAAYAPETSHHDVLDATLLARARTLLDRAVAELD